MLTADVTLAVVLVEVARVVAWTEVVEVAALVLETTATAGLVVVSATGVLMLTTMGVVVAATEVVLATYAVSDMEFFILVGEKLTTTPVVVVQVVSRQLHALDNCLTSLSQAEAQVGKPVVAVTVLAVKVAQNSPAADRDAV